MPNLFCMAGHVEKFNRQIGLKLTLHDKNYICNCCSTLSSSHYIMVQRG